MSIYLRRDLHGFACCTHAALLSWPGLIQSARSHPSGRSSNKLSRRFRLNWKGESRKPKPYSLETSISGFGKDFGYRAPEQFLSVVKFDQTRCSLRRNIEIKQKARSNMPEITLPREAGSFLCAERVRQLGGGSDPPTQIEVKG